MVAFTHAPASTQEPGASHLGQVASMLALAALSSAAAPAVAKQHPLMPEKTIWRGNGWSWKRDQYSGAHVAANRKFGHDLAHSGLLPRQFTCFVSNARKYCPGAARLLYESNQIHELRPKPNAKWLFYGPSYMDQFFSVVAAANADDIVGYEDLTAKYNETDWMMQLECAPPWRQKEMWAEKAQEEEEARMAEQAKREQEQAREQAKQNGETLPAKAEAEPEPEEKPYVPEPSTGCNAIVTDGDCRCPNGNAIKLRNGAMLYHVSNLRLFQDEADPRAMAVLKDFLKTSGGRKFDKIFYMPPHSHDYHNEHCAADREEREVSSQKAKTGVDMCVEDFVHAGAVRKWRNDGTPITHQDFFKCARHLPSYRLIKGHATKAGSVLQVVAPWKINPRGFKPKGGGVSRGGDVYLPFAAGQKYACVADGHGNHQGLCDTDWQVGHPCAVICEADENGSGTEHSKCMPGPAAKMAIEMVMLSSGKSISAGYDDHWIDFTDTLMNTTAGCKSCYGPASDDYCKGCELCATEE